MDIIRWGIIGCGNVTEVKSGPALKNVPNSNIVAVMRRDAHKAADYANRHNIGRYYTEAEQLITDPEVNAIYIATPPDTHAEYAIRALDAGKPVYVEKPMARTVEECEQMINAADLAKLPLIPAYYRRALPYFLKVKELIDREAVGDIRLVNLKLHYPSGNIDPQNLPWRLVPEVSGGGLFVDLGAHQLDLFDFYFGRVVESTGFARNHAGLYQAEDAVNAVLYFEDNITAHCSWNFAVSEKAREEQVEIIGSKGKMTFSCFDTQPIRLMLDNGHYEEFYIEHPKHIQQPLIEQVVQQIMGVGTCNANAQAGLRTTAVIEKLLFDYYN